jgi:hypothetical protein
VFDYLGIDDAEKFKADFELLKKEMSKIKK